MKPEILAPAGSMEALKAAIHAGADAVYLGGSRFGARAYANNFNETELIQAIEYAHIYGVKVYLTINTLFRNGEIKELYEYLLPFYKAGLDAVIVQDLGVLEYLHYYFPDLPIHASTQMTITTKYAYDLLKEYGVTRIVPARELSMEEIKELKECSNPPEVEVFVQGALCYCYSGQCLMSSVLGGRSGNRGRCAQTCRLPYQLEDSNDEIIQTEGRYLLSPKDLCGLEAIPELIAAGVDSFKIEGRMKKPEYVAVCVCAYRELVDAFYEGSFSEEKILYYKHAMAEVFNRGGFTKGYYNQKNGKDMMSIKTPGNVGVEIGKVVSIQKNQIAIQLSQTVHKGDIFVIDTDGESITLTNNADQTKGKNIVLNAPKSHILKKGQVLRRMYCAPLMQKLSSYSTEEKIIPLKGKISLQTNEFATFYISAMHYNRKVEVYVKGNKVEKAANKPLTKDMVRDKAGKLGNTRYCFDEFQIDITEDAFYPLKDLKELRRNAIQKLENCILTESRRNCNLIKEKSDDALCKFDLENAVMETQRREDKGSSLCTVLVSNKKQYDIVKHYNNVVQIYWDMQYFSLEQISLFLEEKTSFTKGIVLPAILRMSNLEEVRKIILKIMQQFEPVTVIVRNLDELALLKAMCYNGKIVTDASLYAMNDLAAFFIQKQFENICITLPVELNRKQIKELCYTKKLCEMEVYGYNQLMVSSQCLWQTTGRCNYASELFKMKDRYLKNFFVFCICKYCYNIIYNGLPTVLFDLIERDFKEPIVKRLHFTMENEKDTIDIMNAFLKKETPAIEKTRGHYNRGVE